METTMLGTQVLEENGVVSGTPIAPGVRIPKPAKVVKAPKPAKVEDGTTCDGMAPVEPPKDAKARVKVAKEPRAPKAPKAAKEPKVAKAPKATKPKAKRAVTTKGALKTMAVPAPHALHARMVARARKNGITLGQAILRGMELFLSSPPSAPVS